MKVGTKSLLFGVHQFFLHPLFVLIAWCKLYGRPSWRELVCIIIHDWGYWGCPNMDGQEGERHPERGAKIAHWLFDPKMSSTDNLIRQINGLKTLDRFRYSNFILFHSRHYSKNYSVPPSRLCWADKLSIKYMPTWLYLILGNLSGEIAEYRRKSGLETDAKVCDWEWHEQVKAGMIKMAMEQNANAMPYMKENRHD